MLELVDLMVLQEPSLIEHLVQEVLMFRLVVQISGHTVTVGQLPQHGHPINAGDTTCSQPYPQSGNIGCLNSGNSNSGNSGGNSSHAHPSSVSASANWSAGVDMSVQYINVIYCTFS